MATRTRKREFVVGRKIDTNDEGRIEIYNFGVKEGKGKRATRRAVNVERCISLMGPRRKESENNSKPKHKEGCECRCIKRNWPNVRRLGAIFSNNQALLPNK